MNYYSLVPCSSLSARSERHKKCPKRSPYAKKRLTTSFFSKVCKDSKNEGYINGFKAANSIPASKKSQAAHSSHRKRDSLANYQHTRAHNKDLNKLNQAAGYGIFGIERLPLRLKLPHTYAFID